MFHLGHCYCYDEYRYAECRYDESYYADRHYAERRYTECRCVVQQITGEKTLLNLADYFWPNWNFNFFNGKGGKVGEWRHL